MKVFFKALITVYNFEVHIFAMTGRLPPLANDH